MRLAAPEAERICRVERSFGAIGCVSRYVLEGATIKVLGQRGQSRDQLALEAHAIEARIADDDAELIRPEASLDVRHEGIEQVFCRFVKQTHVRAPRDLG